MKKSIVLLLCLLLALPAGCTAQDSAQDELIIMTSFYPMYIFCANIADGVDGVSVLNMAAPDTGCLHDYQLLPADMRALEKADVLVINGAGMESFMDKVLAQYPNLPVITASEGIEMICDDHEHDHGEADGHDHTHEEEGVNAHVWLNPELAAQEVENIGAALAQLDSAHAQQYEANTAAYAHKLRALGEEMKTALANVESRQMITFHEAFPYFAQAFDLEIVGVIEREPGEDPGTRELAETCDLVVERGVKALFAEPQYPNRAAETIARETGAKVYTLDPIVTGELNKEAYEQKMRENLATLLEALGE